MTIDGAKTTLRSREGKGLFPDGEPFRDYSIMRMSRRTATPMIQAHYLHSWPAIVRLVVGLWCGQNPVGVIVFADAPRETSIRYGGMTWELARLWIDDTMPRNSESWFIARAIKFVKREHQTVKALVSYADPSAGHQGTIYQAANWKSDGRTDEDRKTPKFDYLVGERRFARAGHLPRRFRSIATRQYRVSKYRYVYFLR